MARSAALHVDVHHPIPQRVVDRVDGGARVDARIGRQNVDSPVLGDDAGRHRLDRGPIGDVGGDCERLSPIRPERCGRRLGERAVDVGDHDTGPLDGEHRGDPATDSLRAARHDCDLMGESLHGAPRSTRNIIGRRSAALLGQRREVRLQPRSRVDRHGGGRRALRGRIGRGLVGVLPRSLRLHARAPRRGGGAQMGRRRAHHRRRCETGRSSRGHDPRPRRHDPRGRRLRRLHRDRPVRVVGRRDSLRDSFQRRTASCTSTTERRCRHDL